LLFVGGVVEMLRDMAVKAGGGWEIDDARVRTSRLLA
jgi:hypothetical protein